MIHVTEHAIRRYIERIAPVGMGEAKRRILAHLPALERAAAFGAPCVRNGNGVGFLLKGNSVTTVLSPDMPLGPVQ
jgi:hypothetical protein